MLYKSAPAALADGGERIKGPVSIEHLLRPLRLSGFHHPPSFPRRPPHLASEACSRRSHSLKPHTPYAHSLRFPPLRQAPSHHQLVHASIMLVLSFASAALVATAGVSAMMIPHRHTQLSRDEKPATYYEGYLENYQVYHTRYLALDCEAKHNTTFFDKCCHPMLATETLEKNRAPECNPANQVTSTASSAAPTQTDDDDSDCEDDDPTSAISSAAPTSTDDDDDCDDDEPTSSAVPTSSHVASSTHSSSTSSRSPAPAPAAAKTTQTPTTTHSPTSTTHSTKATSTKTTAPAATSTAASSSDFTGGQATFFYQGGQAGACGTVHSDSSFIAALQTKRYGDLSEQSANCGRKITLTNTNNGKSVTVTVADACPTCGNQNDLDLSYAAFLQIATEAEGQVPIVWHFDD